MSNNRQKQSCVLWWQTTVHMQYVTMEQCQNFSAGLLFFWSLSLLPHQLPARRSLCFPGWVVKRSGYVCSCDLSTEVWVIYIRCLYRCLRGVHLVTVTVLREGGLWQKIVGRCTFGIFPKEYNYQVVWISEFFHFLKNSMHTYVCCCNQTGYSLMPYSF